MKLNLINISDTQSINMAAAMPQKVRNRDGKKYTQDKLR